MTKEQVDRVAYLVGHHHTLHNIEKSNNKNITVSSKGKITIKKNYIGKATITITAAKTNTYKKATKTITVTIKHRMVNGVQ